MNSALMSFLNIKNNHYFLFDSRDLENFFSLLPKKDEGLLFGYMVNEKGIFTNYETLSSLKKGEGSWVLLELEEGKKVRISQDKAGSSSLYLFQKEDFFVISNSFLYLVKYLTSKNISLELNVDFIKDYLCDQLISKSIFETPILGIVKLPSEENLSFNKEGKLYSEKIITPPQ